MSDDTWREGEHVASSHFAPYLQGKSPVRVLPETEHQQQVRTYTIAAIFHLGTERFYSRQIADLILPHIGGDIKPLVPAVQRVLSDLAGRGLLQTELVRPGPDTFKGGMLRRYYWR